MTAPLKLTWTTSAKRRRSGAKVRYALVLALYLLGAALAAPAPTRPQLQDLIMIDAEVGWGLSARQLYRTDDGGKSWQGVPFGRAADEPFCTLGRGATRRSLWLACTPLHSSLVTQAEGTLYKTEAAGVNWQRRPLPLGGGVYVQRLNEQLGYLTTLIAQGMGHVDFGFAQTTDSGRTWRVKNTKNQRPLGQNGQTLPTYNADGNGYLGVSPFAREGFMLLAKSRNAGQTWTPTRIAAPEPATVMTPEVPVLFGHTVLVMARLERQSADHHSFTLYVSDDGKTYHHGQRVQFAALPDWPPQITASFLSARQGFVAAGDTLYRTTDAGKRWFPTGTLPKEPAVVLTFVNAQTGWLLTRGALYRTTDGGRHWQPLPF